MTHYSKTNKITQNTKMVIHKINYDNGHKQNKNWSRTRQVLKWRPPADNRRRGRPTQRRMDNIKIIKIPRRGTVWGTTAKTLSLWEEASAQQWDYIQAKYYHYY